jgi:hypothetical protein
MGDDTDLEDRIKLLVGDVRRIETLREINEAEWDLLITDQPWSSSVRHGVEEVLRHGVCVLYRSPDADEHANLEYRGEWGNGFTVSWGHVGDELLLPAGLPEEVEQLLLANLYPRARARETHSYFGPTRTTSWGSSAAGPSAPPPTPPVLEPWMTTRGGAVLAGRYPRSATSEAWLLPHDAGDLVPWLSAAIGEWHKLNAGRFPAAPNWTISTDWMTQEERQAHERLQAIRRERAEVLADLDGREHKARAALVAAQKQAEVGSRRLLTADSEELVAAVHDALSELGFTVEERDRARPDEKLEDLHIKDPDEPEWLALAEVKGFSKGAKTSGITQFLRFERRFMAETGREPSALWYVVNHQRTRDPVARGMAMAGADEDVAVFAEARGAVIDTVYLFRLLQAVRRGEASPAAARVALRTATGRLSI